MNPRRTQQTVIGGVLAAKRQFPSTVRTLKRVLPKARAYYGCSYPVLARRAIALLGRRFVPEEAFRLGLFDPTLEESAIDSYLSKSSLTRIQRRLNPAPWDRLVEDKGIFYRLCRSLGLPTPELYAVVYRNRPGWTLCGVPPRSATEWEAFLESALPQEFIVKPACGVYGRGLAAYSRWQGGFRRSDGELFSSAGLLRDLWSDPRDRGTIVQERLRSHPDIARLSGTDALQTLRIDVVSTAGGLRILNVGLKMICGANIIDNLDGGSTGNFMMRISVNDGKVLEARLLPADRPGFTTISHHPQTGQPLTGTSVPRWEEVRELALRATELFSPLKAVGWDIAVTPDSVLVVEGNAWSDPALMMQGRITQVRDAVDPGEHLSRLYGSGAYGSDHLQ